MAINLVTKFLPYVDEQFSTESKIGLVTNNDFEFTGAKTVKIYKVSTSKMNDYDRDGSKSSTQPSRYGPLVNLNATTEDFTLSKDRSFTFPIDKLDEDETLQQLSGATALARQNREVVIPEVDTYVLNVMVEGAGTKATAKALTADNIYEEILAATKELDNAEVPESGRVLIVTPDVYTLIKRNKDFLMATDIAQNMKNKGVIATVDGLTVIKVPSNRLPKKFGFIVAHPVATVAPVKLQDYKIHEDPPGISGSLVEGRIAYDAFVLDNKKKAIYYQPLP